MADIFTKEKRSQVMSKIRSRGNKTTEGGLIELFKTNQITGWRRHKKKLFGNPDFVFLRQKMAIFVDGCFWHGCKKCRTAPVTNRKFWKDKIERNKTRDRIVSKTLKSKGWTVMRFWEHQIKDKQKYVVTKIVEKVGK